MQLYPRQDTHKATTSTNARRNTCTICHRIRTFKQANAAQPLKSNTMNKTILYVLIAVFVLLGLGFLAWLVKVGIKYIILIAIVLLVVWVYGLFKKKKQ